MPNKLNSRSTPLMKDIQKCIDTMPFGPERDYRQGVLDRLCEKFDAFAGRAADKLVGVADHEERLRILTEECNHIVSELAPGKFAGN